MTGFRAYNCPIFFLSIGFLRGSNLATIFRASSAALFIGIVNKTEMGATEILFNLNQINYTEMLLSEARKADWSALLNVSDRTRFDVALSTSDQGGIIDDVSIAYQCWSPETGQTAHDCQLVAE